MRRHVGGMPLLIDLSLAMRTDPLALIRGATEFVNLISAVEGSVLNWCEQQVLRELMSEDLLFGKIAEPEMTVVKFDDHFRDRMGEVERELIEVFPKLWNLRPYDKTNSEITRVPRLTAAYHKVREETKDWGDYEKLPEENPEFPLIRRMLLGSVSVVQTPRLRAFETNERRVAKFSEKMDPCFVGRNVAVLQYTRFAYTDQATRRRIGNAAATPKPGAFDTEWTELNLAPMKMRGRAELPEAYLILNSVKQGLIVGGTLQTRTFLAPFGYEEIKVVHGEEEDKSAGRLIMPKFPEGAKTDRQGPSSSRDTSGGDDEQGGSRRSEDPMQEGPDQAEKENNRQEAPMREHLQKLDCLKDLDFFETMCKILNLPMEVKKIWARRRLMPWFRANMTAWLYEHAKKHMSKHGRVYSVYQLEIGAGAFKQAFVAHRNAVTTAVKRIFRTSERNGGEQEEMSKEDLERNVTLCLHNSFCRNRESNVDRLPCCKQRVGEQKCWRTASNSVRIASDVFQDTETEISESMSQEEEMEH